MKSGRRRAPYPDGRQGGRAWRRATCWASMWAPPAPLPRRAASAPGPASARSSTSATGRAPCRPCCSWATTAASSSARPPSGAPPAIPTTSSGSSSGGSATPPRSLVERTAVGARGSRGPARAVGGGPGRAARGRPGHADRRHPPGVLGRAQEGPARRPRCAATACRSRSWPSRRPRRCTTRRPSASSRAPRSPCTTSAAARSTPPSSTRTAQGFSLLGRPEGVERLGGIDLDELVFEHVVEGLPEAFDGLDENDPAVLSAVARRAARVHGGQGGAVRRHRGVHPGAHPGRAGVGAAAPQRVRGDDPPARRGDGERAAPRHRLGRGGRRPAHGRAAGRRLVADPARGPDGVRAARPPGGGGRRPEERDREGRGAVAHPGGDLGDRRATRPPRAATAAGPSRRTGRRAHPLVTGSNPSWPAPQRPTGAYAAAATEAFAPTQRMSSSRPSGPTAPPVRPPLPEFESDDAEYSYAPPPPQRRSPAALVGAGGAAAAVAVLAMVFLWPRPAVSTASLDTVPTVATTTTSPPPPPRPRRPPPWRRRRRSRRCAARSRAAAGRHDDRGAAAHHHRAAAHDHEAAADDHVEPTSSAPTIRRSAADVGEEPGAAEPASELGEVGRRRQVDLTTPGIVRGSPMAPPGSRHDRITT